MSGGHFNYAYSRVNHFVEQLSDDLDNGIDMTSEIKTILQEIIDLADHTAKMMKEAEWYFSGDTSDDTFLARVALIKQERGE